MSVDVATAPVTRCTTSINLRNEDEPLDYLAQLSHDQILPPVHMPPYQPFDLPRISCLHTLHHVLVVLDGHAGVRMITEDDYPVAVHVVPEALEECIKTLVLGGPMEYVVECSIKLYELLRMQVLQACLFLLDDLLEALQLLLGYP